MQKVIIASLIATALTGCGGGGSTEAPASAPVKVVELPACKPVRIQLFGDSTQWGFDPTTSTLAVMPPRLALQQIMDTQYGFGKVVVTERAVSGTPSQMLVDGTDGLNKPWPQSVDADIVVMNHGTNDYYLKTGIEQYKTNLRILAKAPAIVVFETHMPYHGQVTGYDEAMRQVAAETKTALIDTKKYVESLPNWSQYSPDSVHATSDGYTAVARNAKFPVLKPLVDKFFSNCK